MGKRSDFQRKPRDFYPTPFEAVLPLRPHLPRHSLFIEPCAGDGRLVDHLQILDQICCDAYDIEPQSEAVRKADVLVESVRRRMTYITNPPWDRKILHPLIERLLDGGAHSWLLFDADWMHTKQASRYMPWCSKIVSVGRVKWIPDSKMTGKDNCCWYEFSPQLYESEKFDKGPSTVFYPRA